MICSEVYHPQTVARCFTQTAKILTTHSQCFMNKTRNDDRITMAGVDFSFSFSNISQRKMESAVPTTQNVFTFMRNFNIYVPEKADVHFLCDVQMMIHVLVYFHK